jgi:hypothetical protein
LFALALPSVACGTAAMPGNQAAGERYPRGNSTAPACARYRGINRGAARDPVGGGGLVLSWCCSRSGCGAARSAPAWLALDRPYVVPVCSTSCGSSGAVFPLLMSPSCGSEASPDAARPARSLVATLLALVAAPAAARSCGGTGRAETSASKSTAYVDRPWLR